MRRLREADADQARVTASRATAVPTLPQQAVCGEPWQAARRTVCRLRQAALVEHHVAATRAATLPPVQASPSREEAARPIDLDTT